MPRPNVNVTVSGVKRAASQYKTVILKENQTFALSSVNTRYVIKYNYDLGGEDITVPSGCILEFDGGKVTNGNIILRDDTLVIDELHSVCTTETRPTIVHKGFQIFDTTLNKPLWWDGTKWIDNKELKYGKMINCLGDSITYGYISLTETANPTWPQGVAEKTGCVCHNYGRSATGICEGDSRETFVARLNRMNEQTVDVLLISGGTNDYGDKRATTLGQITDTPASGTNFYASFKYLIEAAYAKYPSATIAVITPLKREGGDTPNTYGITMEDIANAEIEVAKLYGCPVLDLYHHGSLNPNFQGQKTLYTDVYGLHPNQAGVNRWLIPQISMFVESIVKFM